MKHGLIFLLTSLPQNEFECSPEVCVWESWVCDGTEDCPQGEDEQNCHHKVSCEALKKFQCKRSVGCIPVDLLCNNHWDCADG